MATQPSQCQDVKTLPRALSGFRNFHAGETLLVCGCGSSLSTLKNPQRFITIGVNDVGRLFQPNYLVVVNSRHQFSGDRFKYVEESRAQALFTHLDLRVQHPHVVRFFLGRRSGTDFDNPNVLHYTRNSPYVALCLALHMGARRVGVLGVDFTDHHFFAQTGRHSLARELNQINQEYKKLYEAASKLSVEVFNLSEHSRLTAFPKMTLDAFGGHAAAQPLRIVSYATTPVAGVPVILGRAIAGRTKHSGRTVWAKSGYGNGVEFQGDVEYSRNPSEAKELLATADVVVVHNGKVEPAHRKLLEGKAVVTLAHNYLWNVDTQFVARGFPGLVVGQYQATLPEFAAWTPVPNPIPLWEPAHQPGAKDETLAICYTPSGKHERFPAGHRLYWHGKGYRSTLTILDRLSQRLALKIHALRKGQVSHRESLAMKQRSHIVIDECVTGSYHRNSLEGLAAGCVVVNGVGLLPGVVKALSACAMGAQDNPFVFAQLDTLEQVLESLCAQGPEVLAARGLANRRWMEAHWDFDHQWAHFWEPAIDRALTLASQPPRPVVAPTLALVPKTAPHVPPPPAPAPAARPNPTGLEGLTVIVPHGGKERLRNLRAVLGRLRGAGLGGGVVVDSDVEPLAREIAAEAAFTYVFVPRGETFHKARVMNVGASFVTTPRLVWLDGDLLVSPEFLRAAAAEMEVRDLDCLIPWTSVRYLNEADSEQVASGTLEPSACVPVNTYFTRHGCRGGIVMLKTDFVRRFGGVCEEFIGWGGEDNAFFHKATILGRAATTRRGDQHTYHLYHPRSGGYGPEAAMANNPRYEKNLALMQEVRTYGARERFLKRFPPPSHFSAPWAGPMKVACAEGAEELGKALAEHYGPAVTLCDLSQSPDVVLRPGNADAPPLKQALDEAARFSLPNPIPAPSAPAKTPAKERKPLRLNLGCCDDIMEGFTNVDRVAGPGIDEQVDLSKPWPWADGSVQEICAIDIIEHLPDKILTMNEAWRVLRPGGRLDIAVPTTDGPGAFQDPTHVSFWNRRSFLYYEAGNPYRERFAKSYGIQAKFRVIRERMEPTVDGPRLNILLECVKP